VLYVGIALGTGVGFGVVANGQLVRGGNNAIEGGHMVRNMLVGCGECLATLLKDSTSCWQIVERNGRQCGCSQRGCLEAYSSAGALMSQAQEHLRAGSLLVLNLLRAPAHVSHPLSSLNVQATTRACRNTRKKTSTLSLFSSMQQKATNCASISSERFVKLALNGLMCEPAYDGGMNRPPTTWALPA
jgi:hypothetical protein